MSQYCPQSREENGSKEPGADHRPAHLCSHAWVVWACGLQFGNCFPKSLISGQVCVFAPLRAFQKRRLGINQLEMLPDEPVEHPRWGILLWVDGFPKELWTPMVPWWLWGCQVEVGEAAFTHKILWPLFCTTQQYLNLPCENGIHTPSWHNGESKPLATAANTFNRVCNFRFWFVKYYNRIENCQSPDNAFIPSLQWPQALYQDPTWPT